MTPRASGDPILRVRKSHAWFWKPRITNPTIEGAIGIHWARLYVEVWKS